MSEVRIENACGGSLLRILVEKPKGNVYTGDVMRAIDEQVDHAQQRGGLKLITLEGEGKDFSFGASVEEHTAQQVGAMLPVLRELVLRIRSSPIPVAALVQGRCLGGAFEVVLACHFLFATPSSQLGLPEIRLGVFPPAACALLPQRGGQALAERMILGGETLSGEELLRLGLVHRLLEEQSPWASFQAWFEAGPGSYSAAALREATRAVAHENLDALAASLERHERTYLDRLMRTFDANEGIRAFLERRSPHWRNS
ncbi:MAG: enoyl-CoA hydratase/isomerase family protein [Planctomycetes bacterium]|nr:enoyl-CoA hydratase/isomerase family protein [Planctomycetota bacterium]